MTEKDLLTQFYISKKFLNQKMEREDEGEQVLQASTA
jgi:hypothetical protein